MLTRKLIISLSLALSAGFLGTAFGQDAVPDSKQCLMCHGPSFDDLRAKTKDWKDEFDDPVQPHVYLDSKAAKPHQGEKVLPDYSQCHGVHPIPPQKGFSHKQASFSTCYGCHHMENFQKCSDSGCHAPR